HRPLAAHAAELVASVPVELSPALGQNAGLCGAEAGSRGPSLFKSPRLLQVQLVAWVAQLRHIDSEVRHVIEKTEEDGWHVNIEACDVGRTDPPKPRLLLALDEHIELPERQETAPWIHGLFIKPLLITAVRIPAVKRISSKHV